MNTIYKVIWNKTLSAWVVVSELAKGRTKNKRNYSLITETNLPIVNKDNSPQNLRKNLIALSLSSFALFGINSAYALETTVTTQAQLSAALSSGTYDKIILGADIPLTQLLTVNMANQNVVIDGNGLYGLSVANTTTNGLAVSSGTGTLTLQNMSKIDSANYYSMVYLTGANTAVNVIYNNINFLGSSQLIFMGTAGSVTNSIMTFGDIANDVVVNDRGQEIGEVNKLAFTGRFHVTHLGAAVSFENNSGAINTSTMDFSSGADVKIDRTGSAGNITNTGTHAFAYTFADGSAFELIANQDVLSGTNTNRGLQIGSYDLVTGFGSGAKIILQARATGGGVISGNAIDNLTTSTTGINNGASGTADVIYNLATGSILQATVAGILATKNAGNSSGIYIRSAGTIGAATGISATHNGTGAVNIANNGTINSTTAGISLSSSAIKAMTVDNTGGQINASGGTAINVLGNAGLNLTGGTINTSNAANGITIDAGNTSTHFVTDTSININGSGKAISKSDNAALTLSNTHINLIDGIGFDNVTGVTFATSPNGRNGITVSGTGTAISTANTALDGWSPEALDLNITGAGKGINVTGGGVDFGNANLVVNVTDSNGTGLVVNDGVTNNTTTIGANAQINASGATAISFAGTAGKTLNNQGQINGAVVFANNAANTINNNGTLAGTLTTGSGNDILILGTTSVSEGLIDLGSGSNSVTINNGASVASIVTGTGDDTFTLNNLVVGNTYLGSLNAGSGNNTLNFNNSTDTLAAATRIQNFTNINLNTTSLTLSDAANISGGNINLDSNSRLAFDQNFNGLFAGTLQGSGNADVLAQGDITLQNASTFSGIWNVNQGGVLTANNANQFGTAALTLAGTLNLNVISQLNNVLTGTGLLNINNGNNAFNFGAGVGSAFTGLVDLKNVIFSLTGTNTSALAAATLKTSIGSTTTVGASNQDVGNVDMNGGTTEFVNGSLITTDTLAVTNASTVKVDAAGITSGNLLDQDNGINTELVKSSNTLSAAELAQLTLLDSAGNSLSSGTISDYLQGGNVVSRNTYNYNLNSDLGLNVSTQLTQADIQSGQTLTLSSADATDSTLTAQLTGAGNLAIGADNVLMTLSNSLNSYTGSTTVNGGTVLLGSNNALGATSLLTVANGASVNTNTFSQTVGALTNLGTVTLDPGVLTSGLLTNTGVIDLAGGTLNLLAGGTSTAIGGLTGAGILNVNGGDLALSAANSGLSAATDIASGASITASAANALGTSAVTVDGTLNLNAADTLANVLSGAGTINTDAAITLSGSNSFSGTHAINAGGALTVGTASNLGTSAAQVTLTDATAQLLLTGFAGTLANTLSGVAGSTVRLNNAATTTLTGNNSGFAGLFDLTGNSALTVSQNANLGSGSVSIGSGSTLSFAGFANGALTALNNALSGAGTWVLRDSNITLAGNSNASGFSGLLDINSNAALTLDGATALNAATVLNVNDATSTLNLTSSGAFTLNNALTGAGQVNVNTANNAFNLGAGVGSAFTGNVTLTDTTFSLAGTNASALAGAGLTLGNGSNTTVGVAGTPGTETVQSLALNGGTLNFTGGAPLSSAESTITTQTLTASGGTVNVNVGSTWDNTLPVVPPNLSILDQNRGASAMQLISATTASGADNLTLMINGVAVTPGQGVVSGINQNAVHVADATYSYLLSNTNNLNATGLYLNYGLSAINLLLDNPNALVIATDVSPDSNKTLTAQLTGVGGIVLDATNGALTVTNSQNSYTGSTTVSAGNVLLGSNNALGATSLLTVANGASVNTNTFSQTVGALTNLGTVTLDPGVLTSGLLTNTGVINLVGGTLNLLAGGSSSVAGGLTGAGTLNVNGGDLALSAANSGLSAATHIASGASITASAANALGTSAVTVDGTLNLNAADTLANVLNGAGTINTDAAITLGGSNSFSGLHNVNAGGALTVSAANNLGTSAASVTLTDATSQLIFSGLTGAVANTLSGVASSTVSVNNGANLSLLGNNSGFAGQFGITDNSVLSVSQNANLGAGAVDVASGSQLVFAGLTGTLSNTLSGAGTWSLSNSQVTLNNANATAFTGTISLNGGSVLNLDSIDWFNPAATVDIVSANDTLNISNNGDFTFDNQLLGAGVLNINTNNNLFSFGSNVGTGFTGQVNLQNTQFQLANTNTSSNSNTVLNLEDNSRTSVGDGVQNIGALEMNGGTLIFNNIIDNSGLLTSGGTVNASRIDTTGGGTVSVNLPPNVSPSLEGISTLALDTGAIVVDLVKGAATGTGRELTLTDGSNTPIIQDYFEGITNPNSSVVAAMGTFGFGLTTGDERDGLYVNYSLKSMDLLTSGDEALELVGTASFNGTPGNELFAQITGSGDLAITEADPGAIIVLSGTQNIYTGATLMRAGTLQLNADAALGNTSDLVISSGAAVDLNGHSQTVGALNSAVDSQLALGGGALTVSHGGVVDGAVTGSGDLVLSSGTLAVNHNNTDFSGTTTLDSGATADITQAQGLGTGAVVVNGTLQLDGAAGGLATATLVNALQGSGSTLLSDGANVTLGGNNSAYAGTFTTQTGTTLTATQGDNLGAASVLNAGSLVLNTAGYWDLTTPISGSGSLVKQGSGTVHIGNSQVSAGMTTVQSGALLVGTSPVNASVPQALVLPTAFAAVGSATLTSDVTVQANGTFGGDGQVIGNVSNAGNLVVGRAATGGSYSDFIINGNYVGNGGNVALNTVLAGDNAATDRLVVTGNTVGTSTVTVSNIGGEGAKNINGIQVINVGGTSDGVFTLNGRAQAGVLEYFLYQGTPTDTADGNWYLRSNYQDKVVTYNPESGAFIANIAAANTLFNTRLEDLHAGDSQETGNLSGAETRSSLWLRQMGSRNKFEDASGQLSNTSSRYVAQLGGEVFDTQFTGQDRFGLGVMAGYGRATGTTDSGETSYKADNSLTGYTVGVYGTWYANASDRHSPYVHGWLQYEWFNASVSSSAYDSGNYHLRGVSTSLEGGYPFNIYQGEENHTYLTPQAQLTLNGAKMSDLQNNGSLVQQSGNNNLQTRLGAKLSNDTLMGKDTSRMLTTYLDLNWIHNSRLPGVSSDGLGVQQTGSRHLVEVKVGAEGKLSNQFSVWGNLTQQIGQKGYDDKAAMLGVKYSF